MFQNLKTYFKVRRARKNQNAWDKGYNWATDAVTKEGKALEEVEAQSGFNLFGEGPELRAFDQGSMAAVRDLSKVCK